MGEREKSGTIRLLNESIAAGAAGSERATSGHWSWEFRCECGDPDCDARVDLDLASYEAARGTDAGILAPGHTVRLANRTRARSAELREESRALGAEAKHQVDRARRLLPQDR